MVDALTEPATSAAGASCPRCGHEVGDAWLVCAWCGNQLAAPAELDEGTRLADGRYEILRVIGRGGFGITYDVGDRRLERRVAMKELFPESAVRHGSMVLTPPAGRPSFQAARDRFLREARVLARFTHPGIVRVFEVFEEHGTAYLVMELLQGRTLVEVLHQHGRPLPQADIADLAGRVAAALRPVHAAGVLHRDVNPSNVMLTHHGRVVVIDFGLARDYDQQQTAGMTRVVTPGYAPIEQYRGEGRFGPSTDVYGLAATLYRLATGKVPVAALDRSGGADLPSPHRLNPEISKGFSDAILDGLELEPSHRPQDLDSFLARLGVGLPQGPRALVLETVPVPPEAALEGATAAVPSFTPAQAPGAAGPSAGVPLGARPDAVMADPALDGPVGDPQAVAGERPMARSVDHTVVDPAYAAGPSPQGAPGVRGEPLMPGQTFVPSDPFTSVESFGPGQGSAGTRPGGAGAAATSDLTRAEAAADARLEVGFDPTASAGPGFDSGATAYLPQPAASPAVHPGPAPAPLAPIAPRATQSGPHPPGRRKVTTPLFAVAVGSGAAAPVLATASLVLVVLPALATHGDSVAHRLRLRHEVADGWAERRWAPGVLAPVRFVRNLVASVVRASPLIGLGAVLLAGWYALERLDGPRPLLHITLRALGVAVVGAIAWVSRDGSRRFRTGLGLDDIVERLVPGGRVNERVVVLWLVSAALVAGGFWLTPSPFPLP